MSIRLENLAVKMVLYRWDERNREEKARSTQLRNFWSGALRSSRPWRTWLFTQGNDFLIGHCIPETGPSNEKRSICRRGAILIHQHCRHGGSIHNGAVDVTQFTSYCFFTFLDNPVGEGDFIRTLSRRTISIMLRPRLFRWLIACLTGFIFLSLAGVLFSGPAVPSWPGRSKVPSTMNSTLGFEKVLLVSLPEYRSPYAWLTGAGEQIDVIIWAWRLKWLGCSLQRYIQIGLDNFGWHSVSIFLEWKPMRLHMRQFPHISEDINLGIAN